MPLSPDDLIGQFILCQNEQAIPENWPRRQLGSWYLGSHSALPIVDIITDDSTVIGWLLGYPINSQGRLITGSVCFPVNPDQGDMPDQFESWVYDHGGRFAVVCVTNRIARFYLDPCGTLAGVFCREKQILASTVSAIGGLAGTNDNVISELRVPYGDSWYPFGLTPRRSVERLLPNHFLDLTTWETVRHWPKGEIVTDSDVQGAVSKITYILKNNISAVARDFPLHMSITAGRDSRALLACSREQLDRIVFFTMAAPVKKGKLTLKGQLDCGFAAKIARLCGIKHITIPFERSSQADLEKWLYRTGGCVGSWERVQMYKRLDPQRAILPGVVGEVGRHFHWRRGDNETSAISADDLLVKRKIAIVPKIQERAQQWLAELPVKNSLTIWGLLYLEQFAGCWTGPSFYGHVHSAFYLAPFCHRKILETMLSLPSEYRRQSMLEKDLIANQWPELLRFPFNWPIGIKRYSYAVTRRAELIYSNLKSLMKG